MNTRPVFTPFLIAILTTTFSLWAAQKMYLCVDTAGDAMAQGKLVYSYIDDTKTECMPEHELRALLSKAGFIPDTAGLKAMRDSLIAASQSMSSTRQSPADSMVDVIREMSRKGQRLELRQADLMDLPLDGLNMSGANLESADLRNASLRGVNLSDSDLRAAYMKKADLRKADLTGADMKGTYLQGADLRGAKGITAAMLKEIGTFHNAQLDDPLMQIVKEEFPEKLKQPKKCWDGNTWAEDGSCKETDIESKLP